MTRYDSCVSTCLCVSSAREAIDRLASAGSLLLWRFHRSLLHRCCPSGALTIFVLHRRRTILSATTYSMNGRQLWCPDSSPTRSFVRYIGFWLLGLSIACLSFSILPLPLPHRCLTLCKRRIRKNWFAPFRVDEVAYAYFAISSFHQEEPTDSYPGMFRLSTHRDPGRFLRRSWSI